MILALILAGLGGVALGALGGGGSILTVPVLVYVLSIEPSQAVATSLPLVGVTSAIAAIGHWRAGHIEIRHALGVGTLAMAGAFTGARVATQLPAGAQLVTLAVLMLLAGLSMLRNAPPANDPEEWEHRIGRESRLLLGGVGFSIGLLTGLVGIGGGFLFVPALVLITGVSMTNAIGTSLVIITLNAAAGFAGYLGRVPIHWVVVLLFVAAGSVGAAGGVVLTRVVPQRRLQRAFAAFVVAVASFMLCHAAISSQRPATDAASVRR